MKKISWLWALCALLAVIGIIVIACETEIGPGKGGNLGARYEVVNTMTSDKEDANNGYFRILPDIKDVTSFAVKTTVTVVPMAKKGWEVDVVEMQVEGEDKKVLSQTAGEYKFLMPSKNVTISGTFKVYDYPGPNSIIFLGGFDGEYEDESGTAYSFNSQGGIAYEQTNFLANGNMGVIDGEASVSDEGGYVGGKSIVIEVDKVVDFYVLGIKFKDFDLTQSFQDNASGSIKYNGLRLSARTDYSETGPTAQTPAFEQIIFGENADPDGLEDDYLWYDTKKAVRYMGENPVEYLRKSDQTITNSWKTFDIPIPMSMEKVNLIQLFFTPKQIEGVTIYLDNIHFLVKKNNQGQAVIAELSEVKLPASGSIPFKAADDSEVLTELATLTMETILVYDWDGTSYTFFGENPDLNTTDFLNKFTEWFDGTNISYTIPAGFTAGNSTNNLPAIKANDYNNTGNLTVTYPKSINGGTVSSIDPMVVTSLGQMTKFTGTPLRIDGFEEHLYVPNAYPPPELTPKSWHTITSLPFYWSGDAGDAQWNGNNGIQFYMADLTTDRPRPDGTFYPNWYQMGNLGLNHNLSDATSIEVRMLMASKGMKYHFALTSGWAGAPSTYSDNGIGEKKQGSVYAVITATSSAAVTYVLPTSAFRSDVEDAKFNWGNITGYSFLIERSFNTTVTTWESSGAAGAASVLYSITAK